MPHKERNGAPQSKILLSASLLLAAVFIVLIVLFGKTANGINTMNRSVHQPGLSGADRPHFVLIVEEYQHPYWNLVAEGALDAAKAHDVLLEIVGPFRSNIAEHKKLLEKAISAKVDGIFVQGLDDVAETPVINKAMAKGIPVITVDTDASGSKRISYVGTDNYTSGLQLGKYIVERSKAPQTIGIVSGSKGATNQRERVEGIMRAFKKSGFQIAATGFSNISRVQAAQVAENMLREHPELSMLIGTSGLDAIGIFDAVKLLNRSDVIIYGYDDLPETLELIGKGHIRGTVVQKPYTMGRRAVEMMIDYKKGKAIPPALYTGTKILTAKDVNAR